MRRKTGALSKENHARDRVIRAAIGRMLSTHYDLTEPLSDRLAHLLKRLENSDETAAVGISDQRAR
jgi:hypothetical protein